MNKSQSGVPSERTFEQIREHYEIEKELAARLMSASKEERRTLYTELYNELFRRVPSHPQFTCRDSAEQSAKQVEYQLGVIKSLIKSDYTALELGPGTCDLAIRVAGMVKKVYAADVSEKIVERSDTPDNFELVLFDGCDIPLSDSSVDLAYSHQLMEHLHPDDATEQLQSIFRVLKPGGAYICATPQRLSGPHDVSCHFDRVAKGFHLKEYTNIELASIFRAVGFRRVYTLAGANGRYLKTPVWLVGAFERLLGVLPYGTRKKLASVGPSRALLGIRIIGVK